jgi:hypothetical protein
LRAARQRDHDSRNEQLVFGKSTGDGLGNSTCSGFLKIKDARYAIGHIVRGIEPHIA